MQRCATALLCGLMQSQQDDVRSHGIMLDKGLMLSEIIRIRVVYFGQVKLWRNDVFFYTNLNEEAV
jgi:hypothetical protein